MPSFRRTPESRGALAKELNFNFAGGAPDTVSRSAGAGRGAWRLLPQAGLRPTCRSRLPAAGYFLLCGQKKVTKEKAAPIHRSCGLPSAAPLAGRLRNSPSQKREGSDSARRLSPPSLRCPAVHRGASQWRGLNLRSDFLGYWPLRRISRITAALSSSASPAFMQPSTMSV